MMVQEYPKPSPPWGLITLNWFTARRIRVALRAVEFDTCMVSSCELSSAYFYCSIHGSEQVVFVSDLSKFVEFYSNPPLAVV